VASMAKKGHFILVPMTRNGSLITVKKWWPLWAKGEGMHKNYCMKNLTSEFSHIDAQTY
jgi:hypothetical protein